MMNDELKQLLPQSINGLVRLRANLLITTARVDDLKRELTDPSHSSAVARIEAEVNASIQYAREQEEIIRALSNLIERLLRQYQSANDAYQLGWEHRLDDILARLCVADSAELLAMLEKIAAADEPF